MYYVKHWVRVIGPDRGLVMINTHPAVANMSGMPVVNGWCGTTDHVSLTAYGAYDTFEEAEDAVRRTWPNLRRMAKEMKDGAVVYAEYKIMPNRKRRA
jgi:hypothetical protein